MAVSGDPDHPDPQLVVKQQKELKEKMRKEIQDYEDEKAKKLRQAQGKEEESSSTESESTDSEDEDEVSKAAKKVGIAVESLGPVGPEDSEIPEIPDGESLAAFLEDKKAERAAKKEKVLVEESAASKRKSGVTEAGKRMLDQTLDEIVTDIQEEVPPSQWNALFGLPESPTSPAGAPAEESAGVESAPTAPTIPSTGIPISDRGNRVGMRRIDFLHDKPEGWKEMWNQRLAAWKARHQKKEDKEKVKGEQPDESGDKEKKSEQERPGHRLKAQRKIPVAQDPWSRPSKCDTPGHKKSRDCKALVS